MSEISCNLRYEYWIDVSLGKKTVEGRLCVGIKWPKLKPGDILIISCSDRFGLTPIKKTVHDIHRYNSFCDMITTEGLHNIFPSKDVVLDAIDEYLSIFKLGDDKNLPVMAILIQ